VSAWWALYLVGVILHRVAAAVLNTLDSVAALRAAILSTGETVTLVAAAMAIIMIMRRISGWQRRWSAQSAVS
jgi:hypothetical protein